MFNLENQKYWVKIFFGEGICKFRHKEARDLVLRSRALNILLLLLWTEKVFAWCDCF